MWQPTPVNPRADRAVYRQVADDIRRHITTGVLYPGQPLQGEPHLAAAYGVGVNTVRKALALLRAEGLVVTERSKGTHVATGVRTVEHIQVGDRVIIRAASDEEQQDLGLPEGTPVVVITTADGSARVVPAYTVEIIVGEETGSN